MVKIKLIVTRVTDKMLLALILSLTLINAKVQNDPAGEQLLLFKQRTKGPIGIMTTSYGAPIDVRTATTTLNSPLIHNGYFIESLTHLVRERIPERVVHAKAGGAFGYFEVTHDITNICKADLFSAVGKRTPVAVRFSPVVVERGGSDLARETRGFAVKFYTEEGNLDIVGTNTPMFAIKDPVFFAQMIRAEKRNPVTNLKDENMLWDFLTSRPETLYMFMVVFGDLGIPDGYRFMPGFGVHTFEVVNKYGETHFVRFHFIPEGGIKNLRSEQATRIAGEDLDYATRDLYNAIGNGSFPGWKVSIQVLSLADVQNASFDIFDVTKVLPLKKYPLRLLGRFVLNKNPINHHAEMEQVAYNPGNLVPGILGAPDKLFEGRLLSYRDAQNYRLGSNFNKIEVNCPFRARPIVYNRDGVPPVKDNERDRPNYYPNSFNGAVPYEDKYKVSISRIYEDQPNNFEQARDLYENEMSTDERTRMVANIVSSLEGVVKFIQNRAVKLFTIIHPDLGYRIAEGLASNRTINF